MKQFPALLSMMRPGNSIMAAIGIIIGYLYSAKTLSWDLLLLVLAGMTALGFGNVINDIVDRDSDRVAHPNRALVSGKVSLISAITFMMSLALFSLLCGYLVTPTVGHATLVPLLILTLYSLLLKGTPLAGNITVSVLIAYTLMYGALGGTMTPLILPALLASLSNFSREIIKDIDDKEGDLSAGIKTSAVLPDILLNGLIWSSGTLALLFAVLPYFLGQMGVAYIIIIILVVIPLGILWLKKFAQKKYTLCAKLLKFEMLAGMGAILFDRFIA